MPTLHSPRIQVARSYEPAYSAHVAAFADFRCCDLCTGRTNTCLVRGRIPADVLFVGEGPGESEDSIGYPFVGPAGDLLDTLISEAFDATLENLGGTLALDYEPNQALVYAFGNLVACWPRDESGETRQANKKEILACQPRLLELLTLVQPRLIVLCGLLAQKHFPRALVPSPNRVQEYLEIIHPSAILRRQDEDPQGAALAFKNARMSLTTAFGKLLN